MTGSTGERAAPPRPPAPRPIGTGEEPPARCATGEPHGLGLGTPLVAGSFLAFAAYAGVVALAARGTEGTWGAWAAGGYAVAALLAAWCWRRRPIVPLLPALAGAFVVPAAVLPSTWGATSEVRVVARAAHQWLAHGTPYLASGQLVSWRSYDPYLPGMSVFGLPHALGLPGLLGDPLVWLAAATAALLAAACRIAAPGAPGRCAGCRRRAALRALLLVAVPVFALPMALGVTDPPVIALLCLALALTARGPAGHRLPGAAGVPPGQPLAGAADGRTGHPLLAGVAVGVACALKATAWPALPVILALVVVRDGRRAAAGFAGTSLGSFLALLALTAPAVVVHPRSFWQNIVAYPLGLTRRHTPAASPLPGHLLASSGGAGHAAAILLLGAAGLAVGASLVVRPPRDARQTAVRLAVGLAAMFLLAPDARFGYFAYPLGILAWLLVAVVAPHRAKVREAVPAGT